MTNYSGVLYLEIGDCVTNYTRYGAFEIFLNDEFLKSDNVDIDEDHDINIDICDDVWISICDEIEGVYADGNAVNFCISPRKNIASLGGHTAVNDVNDPKYISYLETITNLAADVLKNEYSLDVGPIVYFTVDNDEKINDSTILEKVRELSK